MLPSRTPNSACSRADWMIHCTCAVYAAGAKVAVSFFILLWCTWLLTVVEVQTPPEAAPAAWSSVEAASFAVPSCHWL